MAASMRQAGRSAERPRCWCRTQAPDNRQPSAGWSCPALRGRRGGTYSLPTLRVPEVASARLSRAARRKQRAHQREYSRQGATARRAAIIRGEDWKETDEETAVYGWTAARSRLERRVGPVRHDAVIEAGEAGPARASTAAVAIDTANPLSPTTKLGSARRPRSGTRVAGGGHGYPGTNVMEICQALGVGLAVTRRGGADVLPARRLDSVVCALQEGRGWGSATWGSVRPRRLCVSSAHLNIPPVPEELLYPVLRYLFLSWPTP